MPSDGGGTASATPPSRKWRAGVLGATGIVGQRLVKLLADHPWFELSLLAASERSAGKSYGEIALMHRHETGDKVTREAVILALKRLRK
jgi:aspartate-semialdehyde dehydrogenase